VTDGVTLSGFAFAVARRAELLPVALSGYAVAGMPEIRSAGLIRHARKHAPLLAPFDLPEGIAAKLKIVALLVDGKTAVALDQNAIVDAGDQIVPASPPAPPVPAIHSACAGTARSTTNRRSNKPRDSVSPTRWA